MQPHDTPCPPLKQCYLCKEHLPATTEYFQSDKSKKDGFTSRCKSCQGKPKPIRQVDLVCAECGKTFSRKASAAKEDKEYYCSRPCANSGYKRLYSGEKSTHYNRADVNCAHCGKALSRKASLIIRRQNHFCNRSCWGKWKTANMAGENSPHYHRVATKCRQCGRKFVVIPRAFNEHGNFCDAQCFGDWLSENNTGENNPLYKRATVKCQCCGKEFAVSAYRFTRGANYCSRQCAADSQRTGKDPLKMKMSGQRRRSRRAAFPADFTAEDWLFALDYFHGCCAVCERPLLGLFHTAHMDHWIPLANPNCLGTVPNNILPLCGGLDGCNTSKHAHDPEQWLVKKFGETQAKAILEKVHEFFSKVRQV